MVAPLILPDIIPQPFALSGGKNVIPTAPDLTPGHASLDLGFPPLTRTPIQLGGVPPSGLDMNGILNLISQHSVWAGAGGLYPFNAALATATGGYRKGAVLIDNAGDSSYISLVENNTVDFNTTPATIGVNWSPYGGAVIAGGLTTVTTTGGTTTLTLPQHSNPTIRVTGVLASASTIVFPALAGRSWRLINATTGAFGMVAKGPTGQSLTMTQGFTNTVFYDGLQLVFPNHDGGLDSPAFRGTPTAPTAAPATNNTQVATTAYVDAAAAAIAINTAPRYVNGAITAGPTGNLWVDTSAGSFTITLPDPPVSQNILMFRDILGTFFSNNLILNPQSKTVLGFSGNFNVDINGWVAGLWYDGTMWRFT